MQNALAILLILLAAVAFCQVIMVMGLHKTDIEPGEIVIEGHADCHNFLRVLRGVKQVADNLPFGTDVRFVCDFEPDEAQKQLLEQKFGGRAEVVTQTDS